jgi:uncharacterized cupredoxin-like copper-binding protein
MPSFPKSMNRRSLAALTLAGATALAAVACSGSPQASAAGVAVTLRDFAVDVADTTLPTGSNKLAIHNSGAALHELEVFKVPAGVDAAALPVTNNVADTDSAGLTVIDEVENVAPSTGANLTVNLEPGTYAFICNLPTHYGLGMHTIVTVE